MQVYRFFEPAGFEVFVTVPVPCLPTLRLVLDLGLEASSMEISKFDTSPLNASPPFICTWVLQYSAHVAYCSLSYLLHEITTVASVIVVANK